MSRGWVTKYRLTLYSVSCFIRDPEKLPRNFAMLKILKSHNNITDEKSLIDFNEKNFSVAK